MGMNAEIRSEVKRFVEEKGIAIAAECLEVWWSALHAGSAEFTHYGICAFC